LKAVLENTVTQNADRPALSWVDDHPITYADLGQHVQQLIEFLHREGVGQGDQVAILSENQPHWGIAFFAITTMGAVAVPILPDFHASAIHHILRHAECKAIFISENQYEKLEAESLEHLQTKILIETFDLIPSDTKKSGLKDILQEGQKEFAKFKEAAKETAQKILKQDVDVAEDDLASIIYTSGTTGHSKGVMLTHRNIVFDAQQSTQVQMITNQDRMLSILPLAHTFECTVGMILPLMCGACIYYLRKPPTARVLLPAMAKIRPTLMLSVPLVIEKIYKMRILPELKKNALLRGATKLPMVRKQLHKIAGKKLLETFGGELKFFGIGGAALAPEVELFLREAEFPYAIGYGLTETSPVSAGTNPAKTKYRSTGPPLPEVEIKIDNPDPQTGEGEILIRGENVMKGYYKDAERTAAVLSEDGWFRTGDLGMFDKEGYLYIKGRLKNMLLGPSGENIYPEEIEYIIGESDYVLESLVYQLDGKLVARVHLNYEKLDEEFAHKNLSDSQLKVKIEQLLEHLRKEVNAKVSSFCRLHKMIEQRDPFEKTPTKKIKRYLYTEEQN